MSQYGALGFAQHGKGYREILRHYYTGTELGRLDATPTVRVLLQAQPASVAFTGASRRRAAALDPAATYKRRAAGGGGVVLRVGAAQELKTFAAPLRVVRRPRPLRLDGTVGTGVPTGSYRGAIELRPRGRRHQRGQRRRPRGLRARRGRRPRARPSWPAEALKAQAVAARTYAITTASGGDGFDQYADTRSQVYRGVAAETPTTDAAVAATRGQVVTYDGEPVVTYFFSTSGGADRERRELASSARSPSRG